MIYLHPVAFVPNSLISNQAVHFTTKRIAAVFLFLSGRKNKSVRISFRMLAKLAGVSTTTAQQAMAELQDLGYIASSKTYRYSDSHGHLIYGPNVYVWLRRTGGYTMIRREILDYDLTPSAFASLLYLYRCAGQSGRAFPSLRRIAGLLKGCTTMGIGMAKSTVCASLGMLRKLQATVRNRCRTIRNCYAANSYFLTNMVFSRTSVDNHGGSPIFDTPNIINQITRDLLEGKEKYSVAQFGILHDFRGQFGNDDLYYFDGTGVKVSPGDEQDLLSWG